LSALNAAGRPPLSYSLPGFSRGAFHSAPEWLAALRGLGFQWVTLHPTFPVTPDLRIGEGPAYADAFAAARALGFHIRLEPHLDYEQTLSGGPYRWRRDMRIDPTGEYFSRVLQPAAALAPDELTLGSELDDSAYMLPDRWTECLNSIRGSGPELGHKLNHDWADQSGFLARRRLRKYLDKLDYVAISFYPPGGDWTLERQYTIGEMGLGSTDVNRPWHFDAATFRTPEDLTIRRDYYLRTLDWLSHRTGRAASFWTAGHFDVLGIMHPEWRDDAVVEAVKAYNSSTQASP
jgi:hypothetical protein